MSVQFLILAVLNIWLGPFGAREGARPPSKLMTAIILPYLAVSCPLHFPAVLPEARGYVPKNAQ